MLKGTGWITQKKYGCRKQKWFRDYADLKSLYSKLQPEIFKYPVENFFRFDITSKLAVTSIALALFDAKISYNRDKKQNISIIGTNAKGALEANLDYFNDYIANGRTLARGNLFIYTLPSSFLAEAAIYFGLTGKLLYLGLTKNNAEKSLKYVSEELRDSGPAQTMLLVNANSRAATCQVIQNLK